MKISCTLMVIMGLALSGCASIHATHNQTQNTQKTSPPTKQCPHKNPMEVSFYSNGKNPANPYTVVGSATVSKYNSAGNKRQEATIHDAMRSAAAEMGGDAIINVKRNEKTVSGTVIAYHSGIAV